MHQTLLQILPVQKRTSENDNTLTQRNKCFRAKLPTRGQQVRKYFQRFLSNQSKQGHRTELASSLAPTQVVSFFFFFWLCWVFVAAHRPLSSCGVQASQCSGFSRCSAQALEHLGSGVMARRLCCSEACGISLDQGSNPCLLHQQVNS